MALRAAALVAGVLLIASAEAYGQARRPPREPGAFLSISGGVQQTQSLGETFTFEQYAEPGQVRVTYPRHAAPLLDLGAGTRVWRRIGVGASVTFMSGSADGSVSADVPHPFFLDQHRLVQGTVTNVSRAEGAAHAQLYWEPRLTGRTRFRLFGGPSVVTVRLDAVERIEVDEVFPYDTASYRSARTTRASGSAAGAHAGFDVSWMVARRVGAGVLARYVIVDVDLNGPAGRTVSPEAGGFQLAGGIRMVF